MKSMTGFGRALSRSAKGQKGRGVSSGKSRGTSFKNASEVELDVSVKAVNGRYLEMRFHIPREYAGLESELKSLISTKFNRGTVDVYINRSRNSIAGSGEVFVNVELARKWLTGYRQLGQELDLRSEPGLDLLARIPEVFQIEERSDVTEAEKKNLKKLLSDAVEACDRERQREGRALESDIRGLCQKLEVLASRMEKLKAEANSELEKRFRDRLQKLGLEREIDPQRLAQEIIIQLDRSDVSEEITRLREHLKAYRQLLKSEESQGKKLDFYAQELLREVNTIGSKSQIAKLTNLVVEAKSLVERIREQVQNVE